MRRLRAALLVAATGCATASSTQVQPPPASEAPALATRSDEEHQAEVWETRERQDWPHIRSLNERIFRHDPRNGGALAFVGMARLQLGEKQQGLEDLERSLALENSVFIRHLLGQMYLEQGAPERALPHFERAVRLRPEGSLLWHSLARTYARLGRMDKAFQAAERMMPLVPDVPRKDMLLVDLAHQHGALKVPPQATLRHEEGVKHFTGGRLDEAVAAFEAALREAPDYASCRYHLAQALAKKGDKARAEQEYRAAIPGFDARQEVLRAHARNNLANLLVARGSGGAESAALARAAISTQGERNIYLYTLARACDANGDAACAVESFKKFLSSHIPLPPQAVAHAEARLKALAH